MHRAQRMKGKPFDRAQASAMVKRSLFGLLLGPALACPHASASEAMSPGLYEVTTETVAPHLEENLRYATTRQTRCLAAQDLSKAFPILRHPSLQGCRLGNETRFEDAIFHSLICEDGNEASGSARWHLESGQVRGTLDVKLGGKNMTLSQRVTARPLGKCAAKSGY